MGLRLTVRLNSRTLPTLLLAGNSHQVSPTSPVYSELWRGGLFGRNDCSIYVLAIWSFLRGYWRATERVKVLNAAREQQRRSSRGSLWNLLLWNGTLITRTFSLAPGLYGALDMPYSQTLYPSRRFTAHLLQYLRVYIAIGQSRLQIPQCQHL